MDTQEDRWDNGGTARPCDYIVFCIQKETKTNTWEQIYCTRQKSISRVEFLSDRMSYIVLRGR